MLLHSPSSMYAPHLIVHADTTAAERRAPAIHLVNAPYRRE